MNLAVQLTGKLAQRPNGHRRHLIFIGEEEFYLSHELFRLFMLLVLARLTGRVGGCVPSEELGEYGIRYVWLLRNELSSHGLDRQLIRNKRAVGYSLDVPGDLIFMYLNELKKVCDGDIARELDALEGEDCEIRNLMSQTS